MVTTREIDWSTAVVTDGALAVELTGDRSKRWSAHMAAVLARLETRRWGAVEVTKRRVKVSRVAEESAEDLHHLLEGAVQQVNADLAGRAKVEAAPTGSEGHDGQRGQDEAVTNAFRALARNPGG